MGRAGKFLALLTVWLMVLQLPVRGDSSGAAALYEKGNKYYADENYAAAIISYEAALKLRFTAPELLYNLGNAHYKTGNYPAAILNYERALKLAPSDPDIEHNLKIANLHTVDKIDPLPKVFYKKWIDSYVYGALPVQRALTALGLFWLAMFSVTAWLFVKKVSWKKITFLTGTILLCASLFTLFLTWKQYRHFNTHREAIIFAESTYIKSSPDAKSSSLFMLHSGTKVQILDELKEWKKVRIANGNEGWIVAKDVEGI